MIKHQISTLKGGLTLLTLPLDLESTTALVLTNTGSRYETPAEEGIAHFFEHMVFKGTQKYPDAQTLAETIDSVGADFNAFTSREYTGYYVKTAADYMELALDVLSDMLLLPMLRQEDIDKEKGVIIEEINMYVDSPSRHIANLFEQMVYQGSGLSHDVTGSKNTVAALKQSNFQQFLDKWYGLSNMVLVLAGKKNLVNQEKTHDTIEKFFLSKLGEQKRRPLAETLDARKNYLEEKSSPFSAEKFHLEQRATEQAHFVLGWPSITRSDERRYALTLLSVILGGNMSSRLFSQIREKRGLCYYIRADVDQYHDGGIFGASAGVDAARVEESLKYTIAEFTALVDGTKPITAKELQQAKDYVIGKMVLGFEDSESVAQYFGLKHLLLGKVESFSEAIAQFKAVDLEQLQKLASDLITAGQLRLALIGNFKDAESFRHLID